MSKLTIQLIGWRRIQKQTRELFFPLPFGGITRQMIINKVLLTINKKEAAERQLLFEIVVTVP
jgi:hypothetical protein